MQTTDQLVERLHLQKLQASRSFARTGLTFDQIQLPGGRHRPGCGPARQIPVDKQWRWKISGFS
jgi:hypothetical protein